VYVEKPASSTIYEGRQMVNAARKYGVLMQVGFQNRSRKNTRAAIDFLRSGKLGKIYMVRGLCYKPRQNIGRFPDGPMAEGAKLPALVNNQAPYTKAYLEKVHYDLWHGPVAERPFNPNRFHYNWHWQFAYGGGDTHNQGPHQFDVGRWGLGKDEYPVKVRSTGGLFLWTDSQQDTPNIQTTVMEYADGTIFEFSTRGLPSHGEGSSKAGKGVDIGNIFYGSEGRLEIDADGNWETFLGPKEEPGPNSKTIKVDEVADAKNTVGSGIGGHFGNFIDAVKAGKKEMLTCDIEEGHRSSVLPMMANISYLTKRELRFDGKKEQFIGDAQANKLLHRQDRKGFQIPKLGPVGIG
jgi:predicted dehydrogenase